MKHDRSHRNLFSHPKMVEDLLRGFVPEPWVKGLDFSTLRPWPADAVADDLRDERRGDIVWQVKWRERRLFIYIILELQSTSPIDMALRMLVYVGLFYQRLLKLQPLKPGEKLPPVLPLVLYNGEAPWSAACDVVELIDTASVSGLERYSPSMRYLLIDERRLEPGMLTGIKNLVAALFRLEQSGTSEEITEVLEDLQALLHRQHQESLERDFVTWLRCVLLPSRMPGVAFPAVESLSEFRTVLEANMQTWSEQWKEEGIQEGLRKGEAAMFTRLLIAKFGPLDEATQARIDAAEVDQLLVWADGVLRAERLADIFKTDA